MGVSTPIAADVAEATVGFDSDWHMPKGIMLVMGMMSIIVAIGILPHIGRIGTTTISVDGAMPNVHWSIAP